MSGGYKPPSAQRIAILLWGGKTGINWARRLMAAKNKKKTK